MMYFISKNMFLNIKNILFTCIFGTYISKPLNKCFYSVHITNNVLVVFKDLLD